MIYYPITTFSNNLIITNTRSNISMSYNINRNPILNEIIPFTNRNLIDNTYNLNNDGSYSFIHNGIIIYVNFTIDEYNNVVAKTI